MGNAWRGDDGAGIAIARLVAAHAPPGVEVIESDGEPAALVSSWQGARTALVVDAVSSGGTSGRLSRYDASSTALPAALGSSSTHGLGVADAVELGRVLGRLPERLIVLCVEGEDFGCNEGLSPAVASAIAPAAAAVLAELSALGV